MAEIITTVPTQLADDLLKRSANMRKVAEAMLIAGAEELKREWKEVIEEHNFIDSGDMLDSVGYDAEKDLKGGALEIDVYAFGKDYKGIRNAQKAAMLHYGTSTIDGSRFVDEIEKRAAVSAPRAMQRVLDEFNRTGVVPVIDQTPFNKRGTKGKRKSKGGK